MFVALALLSTTRGKDSKTRKSAPAKGTKIEVISDNLNFSPDTLRLPADLKVTWINRDDIPHTVVCAGKFRSKTMDTDGTFSFTFTAPGEYKYFCSLHPHMTGAVKVE